MLRGAENHHFNDSRDEQGRHNDLGQDRDDHPDRLGSDKPTGRQGHDGEEPEQRRNREQHSGARFDASKRADSVAPIERQRRVGAPSGNECADVSCVVRQHISQDRPAKAKGDGLADLFGEKG